MNALTVLRSAVLVLMLGVSLPAQATNYQDMWWNPNESGWGLNLTQQGDTIFAIWFVYDVAKRGTWFVSDCQLVDDRTCTGVLSSTMGARSGRVPQGLERNRLRRGPERRDRIPLGRGSV
jgi:hypothetical protein